MEFQNEKIEQEIANSKIPILVEFSAKWCGPCKIMDPIIKEIANKLHDKAKVFVVDIEKNQKLADKHKVLSLPTFLVYREGKIANHLVGIQGKQVLMDLLN